MEDTVNRIYSAEVSEAVKTTLVEKAFSTKDFIDKHQTAIESVINDPKPDTYAKSRKLLMQLHDLKEPEAPTQQPANKVIDDKVVKVHQPEEPYAHQVKPEQAKDSKPKKKKDSYESLDDIPDERFDPLPAKPVTQAQSPEPIHHVTPLKNEVIEHHMGSSITDDRLQKGSRHLDFSNLWTSEEPSGDDCRQ